MRKANGDPVRFGPYAFDPDRLELTREGRPVHLQPQPSQVLALLLTDPGRLVTREEIQQAVWANRVVEFDAGLNFSIRQIRRVLDDSADSPAFIETVPRRGYRFVAPVTRVEGESVARSGSTRRWRVLGAALGTVALAAIAIAWPRITHLTTSSGDRPLRIAVIPFASLSDGEEYYAAGLTEDVVTELALLSPARLAVIAPTSMLELERRASLAARGPALLDADFVVRGTVRIDGGLRRVTVRVENTVDGQQLWVNRYDRDTDGSLASQVRIARDVSRALSLDLLGSGSAVRTTAPLPPELRDRYLMARWRIRQQSASQRERALAALDSLVGLAPAQARLWSARADAQRSLARPGAARASAEEAIRLDPDDPEGHYQLAVAALQTLDHKVAVASGRRAVEIAPGIARYHQWLAYALSNLREFDEAIQHFEFAKTLDPVSTQLLFDLAAVYQAAGRYDEAIAFCEAARDLQPEGTWPSYCQMTAHVQLGDLSSARTRALDLMRAAGATEEDIQAVSAVPSAAGMLAYFRWDLAQLTRRREAGEQIFPYNFTLAKARLRDRDGTLADLRRYVETRAWPAMWMAREPWFRFLWGDPEFEELLGRIRLPSPPT